MDLAESWLFQLGTDPSPLPALSPVEGAQDDGLFMAPSSHVFEPVHAYSRNSYLGKKTYVNERTTKPGLPEEHIAFFVITEEKRGINSPVTNRLIKLGQKQAHSLVYQQKWGHSVDNYFRNINDQFLGIPLKPIKK